MFPILPNFYKATMVINGSLLLRPNCIHNDFRAKIYQYWLQGHVFWIKQAPHKKHVIAPERVIWTIMHMHIFVRLPLCPWSWSTIKSPIHTGLPVDAS